MKPIFVAGATGAVGRTVLRLAPEADLVPHFRREIAHPRGVSVSLADRHALAEVLRSCGPVLQLIGTMKRRFATGDTYETSDVGTTRQLVEAAKLAGTEHLVLLSSAGAGNPVGAYLKAKAEAERLVREGGVPYTIVRPPAFEGEGHAPPNALRWLTKLPGLRAYRPIAVEDLARLLLAVARQRPRGEVLEGETLFARIP